MTQEIALPEKDEEQLKALAWLQTFDIQSNDDVRQLDELCVKAAEHEKRGEKLFREAIEDAHQTHKGLLAKLKSYVGPAIEFRKQAKVKMWRFDQAQQEATRIKEVELQVQAKKLEEDRQLAEAELAENAGDHEAAKAIVSEPTYVPTIVLPSSAPKKATVIRTIPNLQKIEEVVRRQGMKANIPGVRVYEVVQFEITNREIIPMDYRRAA